MQVPFTMRYDCLRTRCRLPRSNLRHHSSHCPESRAPRTSPRVDADCQYAHRQLGTSLVQTVTQSNYLLRHLTRCPNHDPTPIRPLSRPGCASRAYCDASAALLELARQQRPSRTHQYLQSTCEGRFRCISSGLGSRLHQLQPRECHLHHSLLSPPSTTRIVAWSHDMRVEADCVGGILAAGDQSTCRGNLLDPAKEYRCVPG